MAAQGRKINSVLTKGTELIENVKSEVVAHPSGGKSLLDAASVVATTVMAQVRRVRGLVLVGILAPTTGWHWHWHWH